MNKSRKIYVAGYGQDCSGYSNWMDIDGYAKSIELADFVLGLGGSDVSNIYYNQPNSGYLSIDLATDKLEYADFKKAIKLGKKIVGICKSSQFGAALAGGAIFQDVHHPSYHEIKTFDGKTLYTNSSHHNLADLSNLKEGEDYRLLAWAENLSPRHINGYSKNMSSLKEPEVVYYPKIKFLAFQNHNEWILNETKFQPVIEWSQDILSKFLEDKL